MHFLREGQFSVASTFFSETANYDPHIASSSSQWSTLDRDINAERRRSETLKRQFGQMYYILEEMKTNRNLGPATAWAREHRSGLEAHGSKLEFELSRLQFVCFFEERMDKEETERRTNQQIAALHFARDNFGHFQSRYLREIQQLVGAMAFCPNFASSPYRQYFYNDSAWDGLTMSFTREFCSLLGLSADSPVYIAATAGAIALPILHKLQLIMETKRTEWTTQNELPVRIDIVVCVFGLPLKVEIPLPPLYRFHAVFVCPVSKEQTTDENPPMMMPCGHVIAQESLQRLSKVSRFKCPYCPGESHPRDATKVFL